MSSRRRIEASRANGALSKGPKTPAGKAISARNRKTHGMLARHIVLDSESAPAFRRLLLDFTQDLKPSTAIERALVETMTVARWRQMRLWSMERAGLEHQIAEQQDPVADGATRAALAFQSLCDRSRSLELINRYETRYDRQFNRALSRLMALRGMSKSEKGEISIRT